MTNNRPRPTSIKIFLATGTPDGIRVVEKSNWTGKAIVAGRSQLKDALKRPEMRGPGVYILTGPGEAVARRIYIGESDTLAIRLNQHSNKDFWTQFVAFTSTNEGLNKASVRFLESRLVTLARDANQWEIENGPITEEPVLSEPDRADAEWFLAEMLQIYPILGVDAFESAKYDAMSERSSEELQFSILNVTAHGRDVPDGFVVLEKSQARREETNSAPQSLREVRKDLVERGILESEGEWYVFTQDYRFNSPSLAAGVIYGGNYSGREAWKNSLGVKLKDLQDAGSE